MIKNIIVSPFRKKKFPEKLIGLSVKCGAGVPPISAKGFWEKLFSAKGVVGGGGTPLTGKIRYVVFGRFPKGNVLAEFVR